MNKTTQKTIENIKRYKNYIDEPEIRDMMDLLTSVLSSEVMTGDFNRLLDCYDTLDVILFDGCGLNYKQAGFIFNKIIEYNSLVHKNKNALIVDKRVFTKHGIDASEMEKLISAYVNKTLEGEEKELMEGIIKDEQLRLQFIKNAYKYICDFKENTNHSDLEYRLLKDALEAIGVTERLVIAYTLYFKDREKEVTRPVAKKIVIKEEEPLPPRKYLKQSLNALIDEEATKPYFDMRNIYDVINYMKLLGFSDEKFISVLTSIYNHAIMDDAYYDFLLEKAEYMHVNEDLMKEIISFKESYNKADEESKAIIEELLKDLYTGLIPVLTKSFEYEFSLKRKVVKL